MNRAVDERRRRAMMDDKHSDIKRTAAHWTTPDVGGPEVHGFLALMESQASRGSRIGPRGVPRLDEPRQRLALKAPVWIFGAFFALG
jgi:hypothetical protein